MRKLADILTDWQRYTAAMADAIKNRHYDFFSAAYRDGCRCFDELHEIMESNLRNEAWKDAHRDAIVPVVKDWVAQTDAIKVWMKEVEQEARQIRRTHAIGRKLSDAYGHIRKTGNNLRLSR